MSTGGCVTAAARARRAAVQETHVAWAALELNAVFDLFILGNMQEIYVRRSESRAPRAGGGSLLCTCVQSGIEWPAHQAC